MFSTKHMTCGYNFVICIHVYAYVYIHTNSPAYVAYKDIHLYKVIYIFSYAFAYVWYVYTSIIHRQTHTHTDRHSYALHNHLNRNAVACKVANIVK